MASHTVPLSSSVSDPSQTAPRLWKSARISSVCVTCRCHVGPDADRAYDRDHLCDSLCLRSRHLAVFCEAGRSHNRHRIEIVLAGVGHRRDTADVLGDFDESRSLDL